MIAWLGKWWRQLVARFRPGNGAAPAASPQLDVPPTQAPWATPTLEEATAISLNRQRRRQLERARRRRDKFVKPKLDHIEAEPTERPAPSATEPKQPKPKKPEIGIIDDPNDYIISGELIEGDGKEEVLFESSEFYGEFNFRDSILDQLDRYWFYLSRMRRRSKKSYELYRQLGAVLVPRSAIGSNLKYEPITKMTKEEIEKYKKEINLSAWFKQTKPSWGCIAWGTDPLIEQRERDNKIWTPKFLYFTKYSQPPPEVQRVPEEGDVYALTIWWDSNEKRKWRHKWGIPNDIPIFVSKDGNTVKPLKTIKTRMVRVARRGNNLDYSLIPRREWQYPLAYQEWAEDFGLSIEWHLPHIFCRAVRDYEHSQYAMARVAVTNGNLTASFGINPRRLAYFFRDRDIIVTVSGQRKRILHYVRPHIREDGKPIKAHFRGARSFKWAGYDVYITIPGRDHLMLPEFNVGMADTFWLDRKEKVMDEEEMGRRLNLVVHGAPLTTIVAEDNPK
jgi:hypothetical protein